jgi:hypothetical protein
MLRITLKTNQIMSDWSHSQSWLCNYLVPSVTFHTIKTAIYGLLIYVGPC